MSHSASSLTGLHMGRSWEGNRIEQDCPCALAPCGLAISDTAADCPEHGIAAMKTMRQGHYAEDCPGGVA